MNTERDKLVEKLRDIAKGSCRSKTARLREIFEEVEAAKTNGASNKEIVAGLAEHGLIFDVPNFKNARSRILKERAMKALLEAAPEITKRPSIFSTPNRGNKKPEISPVKKVSSVNDGGGKEDELERPPGISNSAWSELQVKAKAAKRKKLNSGE